MIPGSVAGTAKSIREGAARAVPLAVAVLLSAWLAGTASAYHDGGSPSCYDCHDLNGNNIQPGTNLISRTAMTESRNHGWTQGMRLGCTFCHRAQNDLYIPDALSDFSGTTPPNASRHPVARNYVTGTVDNTPYLSTDNTSVPQHLDCRDCHDTLLVSYPNHDNGWLNSSYAGQPQRNRSTNPFALRNVTAPKAYDNLCRDCHGTGRTTFPSGKAIGKNIAFVTHDNGTASYPIRDLDNTTFRTQTQAAANRQCSMCHDAHEAQNLHLFSDGTEQDWTGAFETRIDENSDCTTVCHYRGDSAGNYDLHGHGKATNWAGIALNRNCTLCHDASQPHRPGDNNYFVRYRFAPFDGSWLTPSAFGRPVRSVCANCHSNKPLHNTTRGSVGCIDCHDQHAKSSDNNVMMIRNTNRVAPPPAWGITGVGATVGSEAVLFQKSEKYPAGDNVYHYYTNVSYGTGDPSNPGFCDQRACHGAGSGGGTPFTPMSAYLASGNHSGGMITTPNGNCEGCHNHLDPGGSFRASSSCNFCHGQPPPPSDNTAGEPYLFNESISPHRRHAGSNPTLRYYSYNCRMCHVYYTDGNYHNTGPSTGTKTFQSVFFDNSVKRGVSAYDNANLVCTNITCHSDGRAGNPNVAAQWFNPSLPLVRQTLDCAGCHNNAAPLAAMVSGAHPKHLASGFRCSACHVRTVSDNNVVLNATSGMAYHVNGTRDVTIHASYDVDGNPANNWDNNTNTCSGVTCHGGAPVDWVPGPRNCEPCHSYLAGVAVTSNVYDYAYDNGLGTMSKVALGNFNNRGHGSTVGLPWDNASVPNLGCQSCHDPNVSHNVATNPFRFHATVNSRTVTFDNVDSLCTACHTNYLTRSREHSQAATGGGQQNWTHQQRCVDCHDPHGQSNIYMVYDNLASRVDNVTWTSSNGYGIPLYPANRSAVAFTAVAAGSDFASVTLDGLYTDGICETCHTRTRQYRNSNAAGNAGPNGHPSRACLECHAHARGFGGLGGNNVEQFFDNAYRSSGGSNYPDRSGHPMTESTSSLWDPAQVDCYACHGVASSTYRSNECLKCHFERRTGGAPVYHPNGQYEWAVPNSPATQYGAAGPATDAFCLQCHGGGPSSTLGGVSPVNVLPAGETWTGGSGHGSTVRLSSDTTVGPPSYSCRDCHYTTVAQAGGQARDNRAPVFHGSLNRKMVGNTDNTLHEYPHPTDPDARYDTVNERSGQMDWFCGTRCHGNAGNGIPRDDNVVTHTWSILGGGSQAGGQTHPSDMGATPGARFRNPSVLPLSEYLSGALPGSGNEVCVSCHNPHGGGPVVDGGGTPLTGGNKQMVRSSWSDNASTLCKECHL